MAEEIGTLSIGTYDGALIVHKIWKVVENGQEKPDFIKPDDSGYISKVLFRIHPHDGSVRSITSCDKYIASGGFDGTICLFDPESLKNVGSLVQHEDSVESLEFYEDSFLVSGSSDKTICLWRCSDWVLAKQFKGHTSAVNMTSISPTGKFMLSCGRDGSLRMWDLMRAHNARTRPIGVAPTFVGFTEDSKCFILGIGNDVTVVDGGTEATVYVFSHPKQVTSHSVHDNKIWVGLANGSVFGWSLKTGEAIGEYKVADRRIKYIKVSKGYIAALTSEGDVYIGTIDENNEIVTVLNWSIETRITCGDFHLE